MEQDGDNKPIKVLMVCSVWPSEKQPNLGTFLFDQVRSLRQNLVDVEVFPFYGKGNLVRYAWYWLKFHYKCLFTRYDIIHAQFGQSGIISLPSPAPLVVTFHGSDLQGWVDRNGKYSTSGRIMQKISRVIANKADQVIVVSKRMTQYLPTNLSVNLIPCGIDLDLFHPISQAEARKQLNLPLDKYLILFAGDPANPIKRFSLAKHAFDLIDNRINALLVSVKDIPHTMMPIYLNACDVLLLTSKNEGSPTIVKEALACNLPIVSVDVGDVRQRIDGIMGCLICKDDSPKSIAEGIVNVVNKGRLTDGNSAMTDLSLDKVAKEIITVYRAALNGLRTERIP